MKKERLDVLMVQRNLAESREKAKALIMSGIVYVNGQKEDKAGTSFEETVQIEVRGNTLRGFHRRIYGLYAPERGGEGVCRGRGTWTACLEAAQ